MLIFLFNITFHICYNVIFPTFFAAGFKLTSASEAGAGAGAGASEAGASEAGAGASEAGAGASEAGASEAVAVALAGPSDFFNLIK